MPQNGTPGNEMIEYGKWVFKNRGWLPVPILALAAFFPSYNSSKFAIIFGALLVLIGEAGRIWSVGYAGGITRTRKGDLHDLIVTGPFAVVRNPIYISNMIMYSGAAFMMGVPVLVPLVVLYFYIEYSLIILFEESILEKTFGQKYEDYKKSVNRWQPKFKVKIEKSAHAFNLKELMTAEKSTFRSIIGITVIALAKYFILR
jgi:protein-S-isoprenylcysteine O-methyltransferase Ste14